MAADRTRVAFHRMPTPAACIFVAKRSPPRPASSWNGPLPTSLGPFNSLVKIKICSTISAWWRPSKEQAQRTGQMPFRPGLFFRSTSSPHPRTIPHRRLLLRSPPRRPRCSTPPAIMYRAAGSHLRSFKVPSSLPFTPYSSRTRGACVSRSTCMGPRSV
jgi:hypothetical protein